VSASAWDCKVPSTVQFMVVAWPRTQTGSIDCGHNFHSFVHSTGMCRMQWFLAINRSVFHSTLLYTLSFHRFPPTSLPSSLTSSCHLFLGLPLSLVDFKFIYNTFLGILFSSILCKCPNQRNIFHLIVSVIVGVSTVA